MRERVAVLEAREADTKRIKASLRDSEERYRTLFAEAPVSVTIVDTSGIVVDCNEATATLTGFSRDEISGKRFDELMTLDPRDLPKLMESHERNIRGEDVEPFDLEIIRKDGSRRWILVKVSLFKRRGKVTGIQIYAIDITDRRQAQEELRIKDDAIASSINGVALSDLDGKLTYVNDSFLEMWGYDSRDEVLGRPNMEFWKNKQQATTALEAVLKKGGARGELEAVRKDSSTFTAELSISLVTDDGKPLCIMGSFIDMTQRKVAEEALRDSEEKYRAVFETAPASIILVDKKGQMLDVSPFHMAHISKGKITSEDLVGKNIVTHTTIVEAGLSETYAGVLEGEPFDIKDVYFPALTSGADGYFNVKGAPLIKGDEVVGAVITHEDVTERKRTEEALRESEDKFRTIFESIGDAITVTDLTGTVLDVNMAAIKVFGMKAKKDVIGRAGFDFIAEKSKEKASEDMLRLFEEGSRGTVEYTFQTIDGKEFEVESSNALLHDTSGNPTGIVSINRDITERKQVEEEMRSSEEKLRFMFESLGDGIIVVGLEGKVEEVNEAALSLAGCKKKKDMVGRNVFDFVAEKDRARALEENAKNIMEGHGSTVEYTAVDINGREFDVESTGTLMRDSSDNPVGFITAVRDVTERKRMEEQLRESEERYRSVVETASDAIISIDSEGHIIFWNAAARAIFGYSAREAMGKPLEMVVPERFQAGFREGLARMVTAEGVVGARKTTELIGLRKDGGEFPVEHSMATWHAKGEGFHTAIIRNITERKQAEEALRTSEEKLRIMFESITDGIIVTDLMGNIVDVNGAAIRLHGYENREDLVGHKGLDLISEEYQPMAIEKMFKALEEGGDATMEYALSRPDGTEVDIEGVVNLLHDSAGEPTGLVVITRDITERKRVEENLKLYVEEITRAQEEERKRIARELHDETVQELAALTLDIEATIRVGKRLPEDTVNSLELIQEKARDIMEGVNRFSAELRPDILDQMGLISALNWLVDNIGGDIDVRVESSGDERRLPADVELAIFRVAQEALSNVRKHSEAVEAVVKVAFTAGGFRLEVRDYGKGFVLPANVADLAAKGHLGILGMHERARIIDGTVSVRSRPGEGTSVSMVV
jgi:two-component system sensor histidine kinase UhpB